MQVCIVDLCLICQVLLSTQTCAALKETISVSLKCRIIDQLYPSNKSHFCGQHIDQITGRSIFNPLVCNSQRIKKCCLLLNSQKSQATMTSATPVSM